MKKILLLSFAWTLPLLAELADPSAHNPKPAPGSPGATREAVMQVFGDPDFRKRAIENVYLHSDL